MGWTCVRQNGRWEIISQSLDNYNVIRSRLEVFIFPRQDNKFILRDIVSPRSVVSLSYISFFLSCENSSVSTDCDYSLPNFFVSRRQLVFPMTIRTIDFPKRCIARKSAVQRQTLSWGESPCHWRERGGLPFFLVIKNCDPGVHILRKFDPHSVDCF